MRNPFRYFKTSPEVIRLAVMMYIRFPLSLRQVEDLLHERGIDILSLLKTSYRTEPLVFPPNAGYLLRHANDRLPPPRHSPRHLPQPSCASVGSPCATPATRHDEANLVAAVAPFDGSSVLGVALSILASLASHAGDREARDGHHLAPLADGGRSVLPRAPIFFRIVCSMEG